MLKKNDIKALANKHGLTVDGEYPAIEGDPDFGEGAWSLRDPQTGSNHAVTKNSTCEQAGQHLAGIVKKRGLFK